MRSHYESSKMKGRKNPYVKLLKQSVTIRLDRDTVEHFKTLATQAGLPYQSLINLYLRDCAVRGKRLSIRWAQPSRRTAVTDRCWVMSPSNNPLQRAAGADAPGQARAPRWRRPPLTERVRCTTLRP